MSDVASHSETCNCFLREFFARSEGPVFFCSLANDRDDKKQAPPQELITREPDKVEAFIRKWDAQGRALYFCVNTIKKGKRRNKANVAELVGLHADLDFKGIVEGRKRIEEVLAGLPCQPSCVVFSGHGLHGYWWFDEVLPATNENKARVEALLKKLADVFAGDLAVCEVARLMQLPGSHNTKDGEWLPVEVISNGGDTYTIEDLEAWLDNAGPLLTSKSAKRKAKASADNPFVAYAEEHEYHEALDIDALLEGLEYRGNVHDTENRIIASMLSRGEPVDEAIEFVCDAIKERIPEAKGWNWDGEIKNGKISEIKKLKDSAVHWFVKHPDVLELQPEPLPKWLANKPEIKNLLAQGYGPTVDVPKAGGNGQKTENKLPECSLADVHRVFRKWLGDEYDLDAIDAVTAAAAAERLDGDPLWLLIISGPGAAKTETVQALAGAGAYVTSTIASEGALLSATSKKSRAKNATGGLLRKIGERGLLVIKDVTSILSSDRNIRGSVLAAIREIYDGRWERNVGTDGGQTLTWTGRIVIVGAVTTAWDSAHAVVAAMGDRFVSLRIDSKLGRVQSGARSISNTGTETPMREELAAAVGGLVAHASTDETQLSDSEIDQLVKVADIVTMARTAVERDYRGEVAYGHAPEMPTRFAKQLAQMIRGCVAIGMSREEAMTLAIRCARDSIPPLRLEILLDIAMNPDSDVTGVRKRITKPWTTTKRELEALQMLGLLLCEEETVEDEDEGGKAKTKWLYSLAPDFDRKTLLAMARIDPATEAFLFPPAAAPKPPPPAKARLGPPGGPGSKPIRFSRD